MSIEANGNSANLTVQSLLTVLGEIVSSRRSYEIELELLKAEPKTTESRMMMRHIKRRLKGLAREARGLVTDLINAGVKREDIGAVVSIAVA